MEDYIHPPESKQIAGQRRARGVIYGALTLRLAARMPRIGRRDGRMFALWIFRIKLVSKSLHQNYPLDERPGSFA
jgi:hypothetical protein